MPCMSKIVREDQPYIVISALFSETGPNGSTFFLYHGTFIRDRLGGSHIANELFDWEMSANR